MNSREKNIRENIMSDVRPWGNFRRYTYNEKCTVKILTINPDEMVSNQIHKKRDELWVVLDNNLRVRLNGKDMYPKPGDEIIIPRNTKHRLCSLGKKGRVLEISFGCFDEEDNERLDDLYGRK